MHNLLTATNQSQGLLMQFSLASIWDGIWPYLLMVGGFSAIVFVHELGHFLVAKWAGVKVERFAIGFGQEIIGFTKGETRYSFNLLPLGGYVKMLGQEDFDDKSEELKFNDDPRSFVNKPVGHRMAIVSAGVIMNIIFAGLLFMVVFMIGMETMATRVGFVEPDSPAHRAGIVSGDKILEINGERILEWQGVSMAVTLSPPHEGVDFLLERENGERKHLMVEPDYRRPDSTRQPRRQIIGVLPGFTREIVAIGPDVDKNKPTSPHIGDVIVEVDGVEATDKNANEIQEMMVYASKIVVERKNKDKPDEPAKRIRIDVPPQLALYPSDYRDPNSVNVLGLTPLMRIGEVDPNGRAALAGIEVGDTILSWGDVLFPSRTDIARAIRDSAERDIHFKVHKTSNRVVEGFIRPKTNNRGSGTIQAMYESVPTEQRLDDGPMMRISSVKKYGAAHLAGLEAGDSILNADGKSRPDVSSFSRTVREHSGSSFTVYVEKKDGKKIWTTLLPQAPGSIDAMYNLVANNSIVVGAIQEKINSKTSPALEAGIPKGARIVSVSGQSVENWRQLITRFRIEAGKTVELAYETYDGVTHTTDFHVPHCLRTMLGVGPEARLLSIDGRSSVEAMTKRGKEEVHVGYHDGVRAIMEELVGQENVPVVYRPNPLSEPVTKYITVTEDMVDPWLGRVAFAPNISVSAELVTLKGDNAWQAMEIGAYKTYYFIQQVYQTLRALVFSRTVEFSNMSGPLGIVSFGGQIARAGLVKYLYFLAIISANLAVINFLPLPIVDGGLMVFLIIEKIKGSPVSLRVQVATQMIGIFLLMGTFLFVTYNDAMRIWG